ncbi:TIGR04283 family arsenosugar biosynthesis glycosyltransferase [Marinimicrobium sp. ABcell2]|uniref:TIGR04283 family arsenosugar biosynthesis glycosyltransferase n=1 Tax=Marinimicrobium sp. ABcell2 TaxID=3069751 RepID=UPI0027ADBBAA|nr:TIGR04283 family arsenosugar biosynthesis glycosyltransferase [Marinimicrobium sp. ABcell2]MDQ2076015.1 TIGR04283 family arsenosugar biosynthesis glycosyltransferase [Marinimicrobium sp. ABcell2]
MTPNPVTVSIVIPILNEGVALPRLLNHVRGLGRQEGIEVLFVDGGSSDESPTLVSDAGFKLLHGKPGRARQMNAGAAQAQGRLLIFLHADTYLPNLNLADLLHRLDRKGRTWGRFDVTIEGRTFWLPVVAKLMNARSRLTGIATGDQCLFMTREAFEQVGGFPNQPLMEDVEICSRLKAYSRPLCLREKVVTSGRRWDERGTWRTIGLMWRLRWAYWRGESPSRLLARYR